MPMTEPAYFTAFKNFQFTRTPSGVLTLRFHTDGGPRRSQGRCTPTSPVPCTRSGRTGRTRCWWLTGTGDRFMTDIDGASLGDITKPAQWDRTIAEGRRVMQRLVDWRCRSWPR